ncbi:MAG: hypothetical protein ACJA0S_000182 [Rickettsiales bacterium]|jgi:hypothetical protein
MDRSHQAIQKIHRGLEFRKNLIYFCIAILFFSVLSFLFYGFEASNNAIKFIARKDEVKKMEKVMFNPKIRFEQSEGNIFDVVAKKAIQKNKDDVELFDVFVEGGRGNITSDNLLITNGGDDLHFSGNPILIIKEINNEQ